MYGWQRTKAPSPLGRRARVAALALVAFGLSGCFPKAGAAPGPVSERAVAWASTRWPGTTAPALEAGRQLFVRSCDKCHGYPDLVSISEKEWPSILERMGNKAHLSPQEREQVLHFVLAARSEQAGP